MATSKNECLKGLKFCILYKTSEFIQYNVGKICVLVTFMDKITYHFTLANIYWVWDIPMLATV